MPHLPAAWDDCEWRGLHVGQTTLDVRVRRRPHGLTVGLRRIAGGRLDLVVAPGLSSGSGGAAIEAIADDQPIAPRQFERMGCAHAEVRLEVSDEHEIQFWHHPG
jgi:hypothetical protein